MAKDDKVFDVANPGSTKPDIGSKPMIVGHKSMANDPMVKTETDQKETDDTKESQEVIVRSTKVVEPIHDEKETDTLEPSKSASESTEKVAEDTSVKKTETSEAKEETSKEESTTHDDGKEQPASAEAILQEDEDKLTELIESKKYVVPIKQGGTSAFRTFLVTFFIVLVLGSIIFLALVDAEVIDAGIDVPFDIL